MGFTPGVVPPTDAGSDGLFFLVDAKGLVVKREGDATRVPTGSELRAAGVDTSEAHYLGALEGKSAWVLPHRGEAPEGMERSNLRFLYSALGEELWAVAGRAAHLADWATTHRYCGRCGTPTERDAAERAMRCPRCRLAVYPRISPAVIVLVRRGREALLARGTRFPLPFFSTLAGFSEVGETLEETVRREVREEAGIEVRDVRYFGSQPWPFPNSLMLGFTARYDSGELALDPTELAEAAWFAPEALPVVPPPPSISRQLIDAWLEDVAREEGSRA